MYSLLYGLYKALGEKVQYQVLILGLDYSGKTTFKDQAEAIFKGGKAQEKKTSPTVGLNIGKLEIGNKKLLLWDLGGQEGLRVIWNNYYSEAHAVIFVVDACDEQRLDEAKKELVSILNDRKVDGAPLLVLANKQDKDGAKGENFILNYFGLGETGDSKNFAKDRCVRISGISALKGTNIKQCIDWLLEVIPSCPRTARIKQETL
mmetsp:Transcript_29087/g.70955  ORF Transcript_29087/g.70955 Transcript_29087/m.70955 type:complete len:205 (-) Transcript_29087:210-824(-)|eukprot:CAMPEP_0114514730 /NCGR_PEP_ID=MMETSP0109-20121206/16318_1 /TAXON_ID=29199 /ORGANISM="Chlorarachnion reptans, Strain CCCM449" /LENGTH=204 /DNA_ID=CAMNT_0001694807 /DNA_START=21 /DNA_END=635 /DNA_ORIENTATION=+